MELRVLISDFKIGIFSWIIQWIQCHQKGAYMWKREAEELV